MVVAEIRYNIFNIEEKNNLIILIAAYLIFFNLKLKILVIQD